MIESIIYIRELELSRLFKKRKRKKEKQLKNKMQ